MMKCNFNKLVPSYAVICLIKIDKKMVCIDIEFMCFLQYLSKCEHLIYRRFSWTKTTLVGSNDAAQIWFQTFTKNNGQYFVGCIKNADASIV